MAEIKKGDAKDNAMRNTATTASRATRAIVELAGQKRNCTLSIAPPWKDIYRAFKPQMVAQIHGRAKSALMQAVAGREVYVILSAHERVRKAIDLETHADGETTWQCAAIFY